MNFHKLIKEEIQSLQRKREKQFYEESKYMKFLGGFKLFLAYCYWSPVTWIWSSDNTKGIRDDSKVIKFLFT